MQEKKQQANCKNIKQNVEYKLYHHYLWLMDNDIKDSAAADAILESGHFDNFDIAGQEEDDVEENEHNKDKNDDNNSTTSFNPLIPDDAYMHYCTVQYLHINMFFCVRFCKRNCQ